MDYFDTSILIITICEQTTCAITISIKCDRFLFKKVLRCQIQFYQMAFGKVKSQWLIEIIKISMKPCIVEFYVSINKKIQLKF